MNAHSPGLLGTQDDVILARVGAFVIDYIVSFVLGVGLGFGFEIVLESTVGIYLGVILDLFGYYIVLEGLSGRTLGKRVAGIVVVSRDGNAITF